MNGVLFLFREKVMSSSLNMVVVGISGQFTSYLVFISILHQVGHEIFILCNGSNLWNYEITLSSNLITFSLICIKKKEIVYINDLA